MTSLAVGHGYRQGDPQLIVRLLSGLHTLTLDPAAREGGSIARKTWSRRPEAACPVRLWMTSRTARPPHLRVGRYGPRWPRRKGEHPCARRQPTPPLCQADSGSP